jgi:AAHS family 4-hydroxybenzoate transporter-like MFS transporter
VATSLGAVLGYLAAGPVTAWLGHRRTILASVLWFGLGSLLTAFADSVAGLAGLRFFTALALGCAMPAAISLAAEYSTARSKAVAATAVATAFGVGVILGGITAKPLLAGPGWTAIFLLGGAAPLATLLLLWPGLPESLIYALTRRRDGRVAEKLLARLGLTRDQVLGRTTGPAPRASIPALLARDIRGSTILLWAFAFLIFTDTYFFTFWTPLLLTDLGFSESDAALGPTAFGLGSLAAALAGMPAIRRFGVAPVLTVTSLLGAVAVAGLGLGAPSKPMALGLLALAGAGLAFGNIGQAAAGVSIYPPSLQPTGIGLSSAVGRVGSILGPAVAGGLLALHWPVQQVIAVACLPALAAALAMLILSRRTRGPGPAA